MVECVCVAVFGNTVSKYAMSSEEGQTILTPNMVRFKGLTDASWLRVKTIDAS